MPPTNQNKKELTLQEKIEKEALNRPVPTPERTSNVLKSLRTYQGDVQEILAKTKGSVASVVMAEKRRDDREREIVPEESYEQKKEEVTKMASGFDISSLPRQDSTDSFTYNTRPEQPASSDIKNKFFFYLGALLFLLGLITIATVFYLKSQNVAITVNGERTIINYSQIKNLDMATSTKKALIATILNEKQNFKLPINSVLYLSSGSINDFTSKMTTRMPESLIRALDKKYMMGIYAYDTIEPFIIFTETDFGLSYSGMLQWEKGMISDIGEIFGIPANTVAVFEDEFLKNKDLRVVKDASRKTILLYTFLDKNTILITSNKNIFGAILGKYLTSSVSR